jgi:hypothetical protein
LGPGEAVAEPHPFEQAFQALGGGQLRFGCEVDGVGLAAAERTQLEAGFEAESFETGRQALERGRLVSVFDPAQRWCRDARANGQLFLGNPGAMTGIAKHLPEPRSGGGLHNGYVNRLAGRFYAAKAPTGDPQRLRDLEPELTELLLASL